MLSAFRQTGDSCHHLRLRSHVTTADPTPSADGSGLDWLDPPLRGDGVPKPVECLAFGLVEVPADHHGLDRTAHLGLRDCGLDQGDTCAGPIPTGDAEVINDAGETGGVYRGGLDQGGDYKTIAELAPALRIRLVMG